MIGLERVLTLTQETQCRTGATHVLTQVSRAEAANTDGHQSYQSKEWTFLKGTVPLKRPHKSQITFPKKKFKHSSLLSVEGEQRHLYTATCGKGGRLPEVDYPISWVAKHKIFNHGRRTHEIDQIKGFIGLQTVCRICATLGLTGLKYTCYVHFI